MGSCTVSGIRTLIIFIGEVAIKWLTEELSKTKKFPKEVPSIFNSLRYPTQIQGSIWLQRRQRVKPSKIAKMLKVSRPFVSKAQRIAKDRIEKLLLHTARANRVQVQNLSSEYGFAVGYCSAYNTETYIFYSPTLGIQTWFNHSGNCGSCGVHKECIEALHQLAKEWEIPVDATLQPTDLANHLFKTIKRRLQWLEK
jgi:hypothetical protein